ncbi:hypothetical protein OG900_03980 [Streptomyces sp. NBC_00433]
MTDPVAQGARAAAQRLAGPAHPDLAVDVEVALHTRGADDEPRQYADPAALGSLIVSIATLAWTIYNDIRSRSTAAPAPDAVARRVRHELDRSDTPAPPLPPAERDRIIDVTIEETLTPAQDQASENP